MKEVKSYRRGCLQGSSLELLVAQKSTRGYDISHRSQIMAPSQHALCVPEIVAIVLNHLDQEKAGLRTLVQCAQVNSLWANEATTSLWGKRLSSSKDRFQALAGMADPARKQFYANKILQFDGIDPNWSGNEIRKFLFRFSSLDFSRLTDVTLWIIDPSDEQFCTSFLQPTIRRLRMHPKLGTHDPWQTCRNYQSTYPSDAFLMLIQVCTYHRSGIPSNILVWHEPKLILPAC